MFFVFCFDFKLFGGNFVGVIYLYIYLHIFKVFDVCFICVVFLNCIFKLFFRSYLKAVCSLGTFRETLRIKWVTIGLYMMGPYYVVRSGITTCINGLINW